jgi:transposase-like protein
MDACTQPVITKRQYRSLEQKLRIVQEALAEGASVARVPRAHGVNANLVFNWCRKYRARGMGCGSEPKLLPVRVAAESSTALAGPLCELERRYTGQRGNGRPRILSTHYEFASSKPFTSAIWHVFSAPDDVFDSAKRKRSD